MPRKIRFTSPQYEPNFVLPNQYSTDLEKKGYSTSFHTLEYRIVVGLRLFINQIFFETLMKKNERNA